MIIGDIPRRKGAAYGPGLNHDEARLKPYTRNPIQKGTRVLVSLWDSLMFGRVPKNAAGFLGYPPEH